MSAVGRILFDQIDHYEARIYARQRDINIMQREIDTFKGDIERTQKDIEELRVALAKLGEEREFTPEIA